MTSSVNFSNFSRIVYLPYYRTVISTCLEALLSGCRSMLPLLQESKVLVVIAQLLHSEAFK